MKVDCASSSGCCLEFTEWSDEKCHLAYDIYEMEKLSRNSSETLVEHGAALHEGFLAGGPRMSDKACRPVLRGLNEVVWRLPGIYRMVR